MAGRKKQKLELVWPGKEDRPKLEPRILIEDPDKSYHASTRRSENDQFDNMLIKGDNLLALKALEADYAGKVKCIYIDPPFNTGQALENYDDGLEHSIWLQLVSQRLEILYALLSDDGTIFIHIDDNELGYLIALADQVFGRSNRKYVVTFKQGAPTGHKAINPGCVTTTNFILIYCKDNEKWSPNKVFTARDRDKRYTKYIPNVECSFKEWKFISLLDAFSEEKGLLIKDSRKLLKLEPHLLDDFVLRNARHVVRLARPDYKNVGQEIKNAIDLSKQHPAKIIHVSREAHSDVFVVGGERILFYSDKLREIDGKLVSGEPLTTLWDDLLSNNLHKEGGISFPKGKKPESLIQRCLELCSGHGELVLDSFGGSGTTGAVAHKMGRRWIMVEIGDHADTHIMPRLTKVIDGDDQDGISKAVEWKGGGGFRYYTLAPSLLEEDKYGNWVISKDYNPPMLAEAMCKHMGFVYEPSHEADEYWKHGASTESDFIYVTTQSLTHEACRKISEDVGPDRSLLICCKAYSANAESFENLTLVKIPTAILSKCEWGRDDYSLNVANLPFAQDDEVVSDEAEQEGPEGLPLFGGEGDGNV